MLKAQEKAIEKAKSDGMREEIIAFLTTESMQAWQYDVSRQIVLANPDFTIEELRRIYVRYDPRKDGYELSLSEGMDQGLCPESILQYIKKLLKLP